MREEASRQNDVVTVRLAKELNWEEIERAFNSPHIDIGQSSIIGTRNYQQDALAVYRYSNEILLAVVCDGMGGLNGGEIASNTAVNMLIQDFNRVSNFEDVPGFFSEEVVRLDDCIANLEDEYGNSLGGGCTIVALAIKDNKAYMLTAGDSRIYLIRGNSICALNRDHNFRLQLDAMLKAGRITEMEYEMQENQAEALISFLGVGNISLYDINPDPIILQENDLFILCSDGLYKRLSNEQIMDIVMDNHNSMQVIAERLNEVVMQLTCVNQDNTSVILLRYGK
ncbi:MAG: serine/threonine-protein phosphatase [Coprococcus sp.]|nr:serine/threonine-protein phosphatase [Coprococcus sp.]